MNSYSVKCVQFVTSALARVPHVGSVDFSIITGFLQQGSAASVLHRNWFAGLLGAIGGNYFYNFHQEKAARKRTQDENLRILSDMDDLRATCDIWKKNLEEERQKNRQLLEDIGNTKHAEEALKQRVYKLEKDLANDKVKHLEDLLDMEEAANNRIQMVEEKLHDLVSENNAFKKILEKNKDVILRQQQELDDMNGLLTEKDLETGRESLRNEELIRTQEKKLQADGRYIQELEEMVQHLEIDRDGLRKRLNEREAENHLNLQKANGNIAKLEREVQLCLNEKKDMTEKMDKQEKVKDEEILKLKEDILLLERKNLNENERAKELESRNEELENQLAAFAREKEDLLRSLQGQKEIVKELSETVRQITEEKKQMEEQLEKEVKLREEQLLTVNLVSNLNAKLREQCEKAFEESVRREQAEAALRKEFDTQAQNLKKALAYIQQLESKNEELKNVNAKNEESIVKHQNEIDDLESLNRDLVEEMDQTKAACQKRIGQLEDELRHTQALMNLAEDHQKQEKERLQEEIKQNEKENARLRRQIETLERQKELAAKENEQRHNDLQDVNDLLRQKLEEASVRNQDLIEQIAQQDNRIEELLKEMAIEKTTHNRELMNVMENAEERMRKVEGKRKVLKFAYEELERRIEELQRRIEELMRMIEELERRNEDLERRNEDLERTNAKEYSVIRKQRQIMEDIYSHLDEVQAEMRGMAGEELEEDSD
ncbi:golgin subfamily A member 6-like protein 25 [Macrobrachium rosenbergii]|uniref:golgin subfamily A member 6-like protein 25 n=1 Tax=Macrobrachium rosenbergii TaxID=79674 RepID=UPI0034D611AD